MSEPRRPDGVGTQGGGVEAGHVPSAGAGGCLQSHGTLLTFRPSDGAVLRISAGAAPALGCPPQDLVGRPLGTVLGARAARVLLDHLRRYRDPEHGNPVRIVLANGGEADAVLHHPPGSSDEIVIELERAGMHVASVIGVFQAVRSALRDLDAAATLGDLYVAAAEHVRALTGFDRVVIYRLDRSNVAEAVDVAEAVADAHRPGLHSMLGLHVIPADLPLGTLSASTWRGPFAAPDLAAETTRLVEAPEAGPVDLSRATLRAMDERRLTTLRSQGVSACLLIPLVRNGVLCGLIGAQHYAGPRFLPYDVRAAAEFLAAVLTTQIGVQTEREHEAGMRRAARTLTDLVAASRDETNPVGLNLTRTDGLLRLVAADGAVVFAEGRLDAVGAAPPEAGIRAIVDWLHGGPAEDVRSTECLRMAAPKAAAAAPDVAGVLGAVLPEGQAVMWLRREVLRTYDWAAPDGSPGPAGATGSPAPLRRREVLSAHSRSWTAEDIDNVAALRSHLLEALYLRGRRDVRATEALQRSLLPEALPRVPGWQIEARYEPAGGGFVGGDWYDALVLPSGRLALVVGDVTGHGLQAAAVMGQLRTILRATLVHHAESPQVAADALADIVNWTMPTQIATVAIAVLDPATGDVEHVRLGHPPILVVAPTGSAAWLPSSALPPLGLAAGASRAATARIPPGGALVMFSDGLVERRTESIKVGLARLESAWGRAPAADIGAVVEAVRDPESTDDATLLVARRLP